MFGINERSYRDIRKARKESGVFWGTYLLVEDACRRSFKSLPLHKKGTEPNDPRFVPRKGEGRVSVQPQKGKGAMPIEKLLAGTHRLAHIVSPPEEAFLKDVTPSIEARRRLQRTVLRMLVANPKVGKKRTPIWAEWPMSYHRELPKGSFATEVTVHLKRIGPTERWTCTVTMNLPPTFRTEPCGHGVVAIDIGWRQRADNGLRVAYWTGSDGQKGEVALSGVPIPGPGRRSKDGTVSLIEYMRKPNELKGLQSTLFNTIVAKMTSWIKSHPVEMATLLPALPEWLQKKVPHLAKWRSQGNLIYFYREWVTIRANQILGPEEQALLVDTEAWRYTAHHLWKWESEQRERSLNRRREQYRLFGVEMARRYDTVVLEHFDLSKIAKRPTIDEANEGQAENEVARSNRQLAAVGQLRQCVVHAFQRRRGTVRRAPAEYTTQMCYKCKHIEKWDAANYLHHECSKCHTVQDQDEAASINLLEWHFENPGDAAPPAPAREREFLRTGE
jgi:hypothetical protein